MDSRNQKDQRLSAVRLRVLIAVAAVLCVTLAPTLSVAQGKVGALRLLGKFAMGVLSSAATSLLAKKAEGFIAPDTKTSSDEEASPPRRQAPQVSGYTFTLMWTVPGGRYTGRITMQGERGIFRVHDGTSVIEQDMVAELCGNQPPCAPHGQDIILVGSNPRQITPGVPLPYYPDSFRLTPLRNGDWTIADTCDGQGCAPVYVTDARVF